MRNWIAQRIARHLFLDAYREPEVLSEWASMTENERMEYTEGAREILRSKVLREEIKRLQQAASRTIVRNAKTDTEVSWHRGGLHYLESLTKRLNLLSHLDGKDEKDGV